MAVISRHAAHEGISVGPKAALIAFYVLVALTAMAVAIPAAIATGHTGLF